MGYQPPKRKAWSKKVRQRVKMRFDGRCAYCGCELGSRFALDHHYAIGVYGERADVEENLFPSCIQYNHYKGEGSVETMRRLICRTYDNLVAKSLTGRIAAAYGLLNRKDAIRFWFENYQIEKPKFIIDMEDRRAMTGAEQDKGGRKGSYEH